MPEYLRGNKVILISMYVFLRAEKFVGDVDYVLALDNIWRIMTLKANEILYWNKRLSMNYLHLGEQPTDNKS